MATQSKSTNGAKPKTAASEKNQARAAAGTAVDLPVGAVLVVTDRISELVEPFADRAAAKRQLKTYRTELRRRVKRTERRGAKARRRAADELEQRVRRAADLLPI